MRKRSVLFILSIAIVASVVTVFTAYSYYHYYQIRENVTQDLEENTQYKLDELRVDVTRHLLAYDVNEYAKLVRSKMLYEGFKAIIVNDLRMAEITGEENFFVVTERNDRAELVDYQGPAYPHEDILNACYYKEAVQLTADGAEQIGSITICASDHMIDQELEVIISNYVTISVIVMIILLLVIFSVLYKTLLGPISSVIGDLHNTDEAGIPNRKLPSMETREIDVLAKTINRMVEVISKSRSELVSERNWAEQLRSDAESANKAKSDFLSAMSHELRTPLNAVIGFSDILLMDGAEDLTEQQRDYIRHIQYAGGHLLGLVKDVLDLSEIERGKFSVSLQHVDLISVIEGCMAQVHFDAKAKGIKMNLISPQGEAILLLTDKHRLRQILLHLLDNAIKFGSEGGNIRIEAKTIGDAYADVSIEDDGVGIPLERQNSITNLFERGVESPYRASEGLGSGLRICDALLKRLAGRLSFVSEAGIGSKFQIELPTIRNNKVAIWTNDLLVDVDVLDRDHQKVLELINNLSLPGLSLGEAGRLVEDIANYTKFHFRREEAIMEITQYPEEEDHKRTHKMLLETIDHLVADWKSTSQEQSFENLRKFLQDWWLDHIHQVDRDITPYTKGKELQIKKKIESLSDWTEK